MANADDSVAYIRAAQGDFVGEKAYRVDEMLPRRPALLERMIHNPTLSLETRAKVLEVALSRGGSYPIEELRMWLEYPMLAKGDLSREDILERIAYQEMAVKAVLSEGGDQLFAQMSRSGDHLATARLPATQLMHIILQKNGFHGNSVKEQDAVEDWIRGLPPDTAGRAMRHVFDAAASVDAGTDSWKVTGVEAGVGPVSFGIQGQYHNSHWKDVTRNISDGAGADFGKRSEEEKKAIAAGYRGADLSFETMAGSTPN